MKKKPTTVSGLDKAETGDSTLLAKQIAAPKMYRDHKICDHHTHGRVNKFPFGSSHGPAFF